MISLCPGRVNPKCRRYALQGHRGRDTLFHTSNSNIYIVASHSHIIPNLVQTNMYPDLDLGDYRPISKAHFVMAKSMRHVFDCKGQTPTMPRVNPPLIDPR